MAFPKTVLLVAGPTAVGKTSLAIELAQRLNTEIISADSRQCYRELNIGVARPSEEQLRLVKHHFIASHSIHDRVTAATFEQYALEKARGIFLHSDYAVMTGGTGLYIKAFCEGMDTIPEVPEETRVDIAQQYKLRGLSWLQDELSKADPEYYVSGEIQNPQRLMRALEVWRSTGRSILHFQRGTKQIRPFNILKFALQLPKEQLHRNIDGRMNKMVEDGLIEEVRSLLPYQHLNALQTVGYKELFDHLNGITSLDHAIHLIRRNTKQYAKRQMTWFRKDQEYRWVGNDPETILAQLKDFEK